MKSYVINLEKDVERREYMHRLLASTPFADAEFVTGVYGKSLSSSQLSELFEQYRFGRVFSDPAFEGEIGCAVSHYNVWHRISASDDRFAFVLEDDVSFDEDFAPMSEWAAKWLDSSRPRVVLFSHYFFYLPWNTAIEDGRKYVSRPSKAFGTFCYGINRAAAKLLISLGKPHYVADEWDYYQRHGLEMRLPLEHPVSVDFKFDTNIKERAAYLREKLDAGALLVAPCYFSLAYESFKRILFKLGLIRYCVKS